MTGKRVAFSRWVARALTLLWAAWWMFFGLASGVGEGLSVSAVVMHALLPGAFFLISAMIPFRWEAMGGIILAVEGVILAVGYPIIAHGSFNLSVIMFVELTMALPPLVAAAVYILIQLAARTPTTPERMSFTSER